MLIVGLVFVSLDWIRIGKMLLPDPDEMRSNPQQCFFRRKHIILGYRGHVFVISCCSAVLYTVYSNYRLFVFVFWPGLAVIMTQDFPARSVLFCKTRISVYFYGRSRWVFFFNFFQRGSGSTIQALTKCFP